MIKPPPSLPFSQHVVVRGILASTQIFQGLDRLDLENLVNCAQMRNHAKGEYLFHEGDLPAGMYVIGKGAVNVHRMDDAGHESVIRVFREGESFGEAFLADSRPSPVSARAESASTLVLVRRADLSGLIGIRPALAMRMLASMSQHLRSLVDRLGAMQHRSVTERLRDWLLARCKGASGSEPAIVLLPERKYLLAGEIGTVPETLSRALSRLRKQGWIAGDGAEVTILNPVRFAVADLAET